MTSTWQSSDSKYFPADILPLQHNGGDEDDRSIIFLLPGLSGDMTELAALLPPALAPLHFVPIRYRHWSHLQRDARELDQLVADCIRQIESYQPDGTILLVGYSFGGLVAWAVARAMVASGRQTIVLGLIDALASKKLDGMTGNGAGRWARLVQGVRRGQTDEQIARILASVLYRRRSTWMLRVFMRLYRLGLFPSMLRLMDLNLQMQHHLILVRECTARMSASDERLWYPIALFKCSSRNAGEGADLGWGRYVPKLRVVTIAGDHESILRPPNTNQIAAELMTMLADYRALQPS
jgi:thioesterase domain-containing protein